MVKKLGKAGAAHLEIIISFIFFIGFVFFLLVVLKPYDTTTLSSSVIAGFYDSFEEQIHTNLTSVFLKANFTGPESCFYIKLSDELFGYDLTNTLVKDISDVKIDSEFEGNKLNINSGEIFYKVAISPEFDSNDLSGCKKLSDYSLGSLTEQRISSYDSLVGISNKYSNDYENLKNVFKNVADKAVKANYSNLKKLRTQYKKDYATYKRKCFSNIPKF